MEAAQVSTPIARSPTWTTSGARPRTKRLNASYAPRVHSGVNAISGDFSTGAAGLMVRGGQVAEPIREFTIASTLQRMLLDIAEVGGDIDWLPMRAAGVSLVIRDVTMSGA